MKMNEDIRKEAETAGVRLWEIAERYGCNDGNFSRKLRKEFPSTEKAKIRQIINQIQKERRR